MVNARPGFTLIEVLMVMGTSITVALVIGLTFTQAWKAHINQQDIEEIQRLNRQTMEEMSRIARAATTVTASVSDGTTTYNSDASSLVLRLAPINSSNDILLGDDYIIFRRRTDTPTIIERVVIANAAGIRDSWPDTSVLNRYTSNFTVKYYNSGGTELVPGVGDLTTTKKLVFTTQATKQSGTNTASRDLESTIFLRNR